MQSGKIYSIPPLTIFAFESYKEASSFCYTIVPVHNCAFTLTGENLLNGTPKYSAQQWAKLYSVDVLDLLQLAEHKFLVGFVIDKAA